MDEHPTSGPVAEPFQSEPVQLSGCGKPAVIGCLIVMLIVVAALLALMCQRLEQAFDTAMAAIESGDLDPEALQRLQRVLAVPPKPGVKLKREEVLELIGALEAVGGAGQEGEIREDSSRRIAGVSAMGMRSPLVLAVARASRLQY
jgi:hypothetical protein